MNEFIKNGKRIVSKPVGLDYELICGKVYNLKYDNWEEYSYLEEDGTLNMPNKVYSTKDEQFFAKRVHNYFTTTTKNTVGVMLAGLKGSGKTVTAKLIAKNSELPIIIVNPDYPARKLNDFFTKFSQQVCVVFDEIEKNERYWPSEQLLTFLDGVQETARKLVIFTCNNDKTLSEFVKDRCSRIRYYRTFGQMEEEMIREIVNDVIVNKSKTDDVVKYITKHFETRSYDNIISFLEEINVYSDDFIPDDLDKVIKDMNIVTKNVTKKK